MRPCSVAAGPRSSNQANGLASSWTSWPIARARSRRLRCWGARRRRRAARRRRRAPQHRSRRERALAMGQLVQLDASPFAWFEDRGPAATLHGLIDDATSTPLALWFRPTEDLHGYLTVLGHTCRAYG